MSFYKKKPALIIVILLLTLVVKPAFAELEILPIEVLDQTRLEHNFDEQVLVEGLDQKEVSEMTQKSHSLETYVNSLEHDVAAMITRINNMENEIENLHMTENQLEKFASTKNVDVAEKDYYEGIGYDKDIYEHGKELAGSDTKDFYSQYLEL